MLFTLLMVPFALSTWAQDKKEVHILSANDMHAAIECFPRLCFVADSLRALYPDLLILSAGDNRSGDPINDMYEIPAYPMVSLMNIVGFQASTLGNHEFDSGQEGLAKLINMSIFPYLCANITRRKDGYSCAPLADVRRGWCPTGYYWRNSPWSHG